MYACRISIENNCKSAMLALVAALFCASAVVSAAPQSAPLPEAVSGAVAPFAPDQDGGVGETAFRSPGYPGYHKGMAVIRRGELAASLYGQLQTRATFFTGADNLAIRGDLAERPGFAVPRARFGVAGNLADHVAFAIGTDITAEGGASVNDAWLTYSRFRYLHMTFGARKLPFSRSALVSSSEQALAERSRASAWIAPYRQVGITLAGRYEDIGLDWDLGLYNGFIRHGSFYEGYSENDGLSGNRFNGLSTAGRVAWSPLGKMGDAMADMERAPLRFAIGLSGILNDAGTVKSTHYGADLLVKVRGLHMLVEALHELAEPVEKPTEVATIPAGLSRGALVFEVGYVLDRVSFAGRAELIDPNLDVDDHDDEVIGSVALGYHFIRNLLRVQLQFDHRQELNGPSVDNDTAFAQIQLRL